MKSLAVSERPSTISAAHFGDGYQRSRRRWQVNLLVSSIGLTITGISGLALAGASLLHVISSTGRLSTIGVFLLGITFPILILAAHCLDRIDDANKAIKIANYRRKLFNSSDSETFDRR